MEITEKGPIECEIPEGVKKLSKLLDPTEAESREKDIARARKTYEENFGTLDLKNIRVYQNLFEIFWYTQVPCFDQILTSDEKR